MDTTQSTTPRKTSLPSGPKLLVQAFSLYKENWAVIGGIAAIPFLVNTLSIFVAQLSVSSIIVFLLALAIGFLSYGALLTAVVQEGKPAGGIAGAYRNGARMLFAYGWLSLLSGLATMGAYLLFIIPGIAISIWLTLSPYVLFAENKRGLSALLASYNYMKGYWWAVFGRILFAGLLSLVLQFFITVLLSGFNVSSIIEGGAKSPALQLIGLINTYFIAMPLAAFYLYLLYRSLKEIKAGVSFQV
ncbi:MAG: hypothetical protein Q8O97_03430, partial [bacterium]|nr:hypothetical protein [bacterium]